MEPKKYKPVEVNPQTCSPEEAERHLRGFAESFIDKHYSERWVHLLIEKPEKAGKALHKFENQLNESCCEDIGRGADTFPSSLAEVYGAKVGVYFDGSEPPCKVSVAEAATLAVERFADAIFSLEAGRGRYSFTMIVDCGYAKLVAEA
jgi:hypothetical protein